MDTPPRHTPCRIYTWFLTEIDLKRGPYIWIGLSLMVSGFISMAVQTGYLLAARPIDTFGWLLGSTLFLLGLVSVLAGYVLPRLATVYERHRQKAYWSQIRERSWVARNLRYQPVSIRLVCKDDMEYLIVRLCALDCLDCQVFAFSLAKAGWMYSDDPRIRVMFPTAHVGVLDDGTPYTRFGDQVIVISARNDLCLQPWDEIAASDSPLVVTEQLLDL